MPQALTKKLKIAVYAIAKNEQQFVNRFMDSCSDADIVVVGVDEGDTTGSLLTERGAVVGVVSLPKFRFDHYRNEVLKHVPDDVDVCVSLDLDEVLPDGWRQVIERDWVEGTTRLHYYLQWSADNLFSYDRIHARHGYTWRHANHESVYALRPEYEVVSNSALTVTHLPDSTKDRSKNLPLLEFAVEEEPHDTRMNWYLLREYYYEEMYQECIDQAVAYLDLKPQWKEERAWACIFAARSHLMDGRFHDCVAWLCMGDMLGRVSKDPLFELAGIYYNESEYARGYDTICEVERRGAGSGLFFETNGSRSYQFYLLKGRLEHMLGFPHCTSLKKALRIKPDCPEADEISKILDELK